MKKQTMHYEETNDALAQKYLAGSITANIRFKQLPPAILYTDGYSWSRNVASTALWSVGQTPAGRTNLSLLVSSAHFP